MGERSDTLRADLAAARLDAANARSVAVEALALLDARLNTRTLEGYVFKDEAEAQAATLRARLDASDFAARATAAIRAEYAAFSQDPTRVSSMRLMASQFTEKLTALLREVPK